MKMKTPLFSPGHRSWIRLLGGLAALAGSLLPGRAAAQNLTLGRLEGEAIVNVPSAGNFTTIIADNATVGEPDGLTYDGNGDLYIANGASIAEIAANGTVSTFASGPALDGVEAVAVDGNGYIYGANELTGDIIKISPDGSNQTLFAQGLSEPEGLAFNGNGTLYVTEYSVNATVQINPSGAVTILATGLNGPSGVTVNQSGNVFVANLANATVTEITSAGGTSTYARGFVEPYGVAADNFGNLFVADPGNQTLFLVGAPGATPVNYLLGGAFSVAFPMNVVIGAEPQGTTAAAGENVTFSVTAGGAQPLTYQWLQNGANISGATNATLALSNVTAGNAGSYAVVISNPYNSVVTSEPAVLAIVTQPTISTQPQNTTIFAGSNTTLSVSATGGGLSYQWFFNGTDIDGATDSSLALSNVALDQAGNYTVFISNAAGNVTSDDAELTVNSVPPAIVHSPSNMTVVAGKSATLSVTASGTAPLSYQWQFNNANITGATGASYTVAKLTPANTGNYDVVVTNAAGSVTSKAASLTIVVSVSIVTQPKARTAHIGDVISFSVKAAGSTPITYQWLYNGAVLSNNLITAGATTSKLTLKFVTPFGAGSYRVRVTNAAKTVTSASVKLTVKK
jgi:hypothetical protein